MRRRKLCQQSFCIWNNIVSILWIIRNKISSLVTSLVILFWIECYRSCPFSFFWQPCNLLYRVLTISMFCVEKVKERDEGNGAEKCQLVGSSRIRKVENNFISLYFTMYYMINILSFPIFWLFKNSYRLKYFTEFSNW